MPRILERKGSPRLALVAAALLAFLPFIGRPLFVDDHAVFAQAEDLIHHPSVPYAKTPSIPGWGGQEAVGEDNPLAHFYLLAAFIKLWGSDVWKSHLAMVPIHIAGLLSFFALARRYVRHALWATCLWLFSPHYWLTANSLLVDGLLASLMIIGVAGWIRGWEGRSTGWCLLGAFALGLTPLVKYTGLLSWGVIALWMTLEERWRRDARLGLLAIPLGMFLGWLAWTHHLYGQNHFTAVARSHMVIPHLRDWITLGAFTIATTPCLMLLFFLGLSAPVRVSRPGAIKQRLFLALWALGGLVGLAFALDWVCARFLVIIGPPLVLLTVRTLEERTAIIQQPSFRWTATGALGLLGGLLACADYAQADVDRKVARDLQAWWSQAPRHPPPRHPSGVGAASYGQAYYPGAALGGLSYYLPAGTWKPAAQGALLRKGDLILLPRRTLPPAFYPHCSAIREIARFVYTSRIPLRTLDSVSGAGFYGSIWGPLPFSFSTAPLEVYTLAVCEGERERTTRPGRARSAPARGP